MKVHILSTNKKGSFDYEGARLRKTLKGACEEVGITHLDEATPDMELAHFLTPEDVALAEKVKRNGCKVVVSAFYCENDPRASFLLKNGTLKFEASKLLELADLVLVPSQGAKDLLDSFNLFKLSRIVELGVNEERFKTQSPDWAIFPRYYGLRPNDKFAIAVGSYTEKDSPSQIERIATLCPEMRFYFFGTGKKRLPMGSYKNNIQSKKAPNLHFQPIVEDDVYRSALMNSSAYLVLSGNKGSEMGILEALSAKIQVVGLYPSMDFALKPLEGSGVYFDSEEALADYLSKLYKGEAKTTIIQGYNLAKRRSLAQMGSQLKACYEELFQKGGTEK